MSIAGVLDVGAALSTWLAKDACRRVMVVLPLEPSRLGSKSLPAAFQPLMFSNTPRLPRSGPASTASQPGERCVEKHHQRPLRPAAERFPSIVLLAGAGCSLSSSLLHSSPLPPLSLLTTSSFTSSSSLCNAAASTARAPAGFRPSKCVAARNCTSPARHSASEASHKITRFYENAIRLPLRSRVQLIFAFSSTVRHKTASVVHGSLGRLGLDHFES